MPLNKTKTNGYHASAVKKAFRMLRFVANSKAHKPMMISSPPESSILLMAGTLGKVFLAQMEDAKVSRITEEQGLPQFTNT